MADVTLELKNLEAFRKAMSKAPQIVENASAKFFTRQSANLRRIIWNDPWRVGMAGGGIPVASGTLRDTQEVDLQPFSLKIMATRDYANYIYKKRPWYDYALETSRSQIERDAQAMIDGVVKELAV